MPNIRNKHISRRDILLNEMGIWEWKLTKADALKGIVNISIDDDIQLVIIIEQDLDKSHPFIQDLLRSLDILEQDCLLVNFDFLPYLHIKHQPYILAFIENPEYLAKLKEYLPDNLTEWHTSSLATLQQSTQQKRQLWQQIQKIN